MPSVDEGEEEDEQRDERNETNDAKRATDVKALDTPQGPREAEKVSFLQRLDMRQARSSQVDEPVSAKGRGGGLSTATTPLRRLTTSPRGTCLQNHCFDERTAQFSGFIRKRQSP
ncbi:hypothetical protein ColTof4_12576 [Colletotrichum tofieldiae]|nr:hypothetical protein ColTof3_06470 [Colletotrichum tofieldiae]GKT80153.1 hypothetical protein ColTof4_12576 [Colletotrichum tofieldiae]